jgi:hypothetical protein
MSSQRYVWTRESSRKSGMALSTLSLRFVVEETAVSLSLTLACRVLSHARSQTGLTAKAVTAHLNRVIRQDYRGDFVKSLKDFIVSEYPAVFPNATGRTYMQARTFCVHMCNSLVHLLVYGAAGASRERCRSSLPRG